MQPARSTTILSVRRDGQVALGGDGQVTLGNIVAKQDAVKIRRIGGGKVLTGFAGSAADAFALLERFEKKLAEFPDNTKRAVIELAHSLGFTVTAEGVETGPVMDLLANADCDLVQGYFIARPADERTTTALLDAQATQASRL